MSREPDAWVGSVVGGLTPLVLRPGTHVKHWLESGAMLEPAFIRTPEDRKTLLAAAEILSQLWERALTQERMNYLSELAAKLREMAGDAP